MVRRRYFVRIPTHGYLLLMTDSQGHVEVYQVPQIEFLFTILQRPASGMCAAPFVFHDVLLWTLLLAQFLRLSCAWAIDIARDDWARSVSIILDGGNLEIST